MEDRPFLLLIDPENPSPLSFGRDVAGNGPLQCPLMDVDHLAATVQLPSPVTTFLLCPNMEASALHCLATTLLSADHKVCSEFPQLLGSRPALPSLADERDPGKGLFRSEPRADGPADEQSLLHHSKKHCIIFSVLWDDTLLALSDANTTDQEIHTIVKEKDLGRPINQAEAFKARHKRNNRTPGDQDFCRTLPEDSQDLPLSQEQNGRIWLDAVGGLSRYGYAYGLPQRTFRKFYSELEGLSSFQDDESRETILDLKQ
ncbi:hypothetical protein BC332_23810 [Capsicum chinense]|nr:hypothetical protein BC332_23810 [Capsicum chinense]